MVFLWFSYTTKIKGLGFRLLKTKLGDMLRRFVFVQETDTVRETLCLVIVEEQLLAPNKQRGIAKDGDWFGKFVLIWPPNSTSQRQETR